MQKKIIGGMTVAGLLLAASGALAAGDVTVLNTNVASVYSTAAVSANTGWNAASAGAFAAGGNGGGAAASNDGLAVGGMGGNGEAHALGGEITTGDALASSLILNDVNSTDVTVDVHGCGCKTITEKHDTGSEWGASSDWWWKWGSEEEHASEWDKSFYKETPVPQGDILVANTNVADVENVALVGADTGWNYVGAEAAAAGGNGGDALVTGGFSWWWKHHNDQGGGEAIGGDAGEAMADAMGGTILTGDAASLSEIGSVVNDTVVHVTKS